VDSGKSDGRCVHLLGCEGWRYYSRKHRPHFAALRYLVGTDDSGRWAIRVPGTLTTVADAVDWITPAGVRRARAQKRRVLRQGNLYLIEAPAARHHLDSHADAEFGSHHYFRRARLLIHPEHAPLTVPPGRWQAHEQRSLATGRGAARD
jgi:hypothetical protein